MRAASKGFLKALANSRSEWKKIKRVKCDTCPRSAIWEHPSGGMRCGVCSRPESGKTT